MHGPPEVVERTKFMKKLEETRKAQTRVKTKMLDDEGLRNNVKQLYETAQMRRKTLESRCVCGAARARPWLARGWAGREGAEGEWRGDGGDGRGRRWCEGRQKR